MLSKLLMAALVLYATNNLAGVYQELSTTSPGADATSSPNVGWTVGTTAPTVYSKLDAGVKQAANTFAATPVEPDGSIDTIIGDCLRYGPVSGDFANANWTCAFVAIAVGNGGSQDGRAGFRVLTSPNADGTGATERTGARQAGGLVTNLTTSAQQSSSATFSLPAFTLTNEYIFVQVGWEITGAGGMAAADVIMRIGNTATIITTSDFTPAASAAKHLALLGVG